MYSSIWHDIIRIHSSLTPNRKRHQNVVFGVFGQANVKSILLGIHWDFSSLKRWALFHVIIISITNVMKVWRIYIRNWAIKKIK
jgi:hypothetical protein